MSSKPVRAAIPETLFAPVPIPVQAPAKEGLAALPGTKLFYWDTGGDGVPVILVHPATGSALFWPYQQPALAAAGFRVIGYSRRGYFGSDAADPTNAGVASEDLLALANFLGLKKFAAVASAAGCTVTLDFAMSHADRLLAAVVSGGSLGNMSDPEYLRANASVATKGFEEMPPEFRELGPSYRAANPAGVKAWIELEKKSLAGNRMGPKNANAFNWSTLGAITTPTLFLAGAADLYAPPALMRIAAAHVPGAEMQIFPECGHSAYWEQPAAFNRAVIEFVGQTIK